MKEGRLISFEGVDGAGKTTQIDLLEKWLNSRHIPYVRTREPGGTPLGVEIRKILLSINDPNLKISPLAEVFLFQTDRVRHFDTVVLPALEEGKLVISDRCFDASIAYQGYGRGVDVELIRNLSLLAMKGRIPDLTILLSLDPLEVHERVGRVQQLFLPNFADEMLDQNGTREELNRLDIEAQSFHKRVRKGFRILADADPKRIRVVDASHSIEWIHQRIIKLIKPLLPVDVIFKSDHPRLFESDGESIGTVC